MDDTLFRMQEREKEREGVCWIFIIELSEELNEMARNALEIVINVKLRCVLYKKENSTVNVL